MINWNFITSHGLVLLYIFKNHSCTARDISLATKITERSVHRIINELDSEGYIQRRKVGRINSYGIDTQLVLRHPLTKDVLVEDFLTVLQTANQ